MEDEDKKNDWCDWKLLFVELWIYRKSNFFTFLSIYCICPTKMLGVHRKELRKLASTCFIFPFILPTPFSWRINHLEFGHNFRRKSCPKLSLIRLPQKIAFSFLIRGNLAMTSKTQNTGWSYILNISLSIKKSPLPDELENSILLMKVNGFWNDWSVKYVDQRSKFYLVSAELIDEFYIYVSINWPIY